MRRRPKLFISYSHDDAALADEVASVCKELAIPCFLDRKDINWGESIRNTVAHGLGQATHVLVIVSPASLKSGWVPFEVGFAIGRGIHVLPLLTHPSLDLPGYLGDPLYRINRDLRESLSRALVQSPTPRKRPRSNEDSDWIATLHADLLETTANVGGRRLSSHEVFIAVFSKLILGLPAEDLGAMVASELGMSGHYYSRESPPEPFGTLLAPLVTNNLVRVQKRTSGVRVVLFATERGKKYGHSFS